MAKFIAAAISIVAAAYLGPWAAAAVSFAAQMAAGSIEAKEQRRKMRNQYNDSLKDRLEQFTLTDKPRSICYGRVRNADGPIFRAEHGKNSKFLTSFVAVAGHEIDGFEEYWADDERLQVDAAGNVTGVLRDEIFYLTGGGANTYTLAVEPSKGQLSAVITWGPNDTQSLPNIPFSGKSVTVQAARSSAEKGTIVFRYRPKDSPFFKSDIDTKQATGVCTGSPQTVTATGLVLAADVIVNMGGEGYVESLLVVDIDGAKMTFTGPAGGYGYRLVYQLASGGSKIKITPFLGSPGQDASAALAPLLPELIRPGVHRFAGIAGFLVTSEYDTDVFPNGSPVFSAVFRGRRVFDWRTGQTVWTRNNGLIAKDWANHPNGGAVPLEELDLPFFTAAANACDGVQTFTVPGPTTDAPVPPTRNSWASSATEYSVIETPFSCDIAIPTDGNPEQAFTNIVQAMGGKHGWAGGLLRLRAGAYTAPLKTIDETWLSGKGKIEIVPEVPMDDAVNVYNPSIADRAQGFKAVPVPPVRADAYIAADGQTLPRDLALQACTSAVQAQHICALLMRQERNGLTYKLPCNLRALEVDFLENHRLNFARFGAVAKVVEVVSREFTLDGGVNLFLKETSALDFVPDNLFSPNDTSPNSLLPSPWFVPQVTGLVVVDDTILGADGGYITRSIATWDQVPSAAVQQSGTVEVAYFIPRDGMPEGDWASVIVPGDATRAEILGLPGGVVAIYRARAANTIPVRGAWSLQALNVTGEIPSLTWDSITGRPTVYRITAAGFNGARSPILPHTLGLYLAATDEILAGGQRSYIVATFEGGTFEAAHFFDVLSGGTDPSLPLSEGGAAAMATFLANLPATKRVLIYTFDEPQLQRLTGGLLEQMLNYGASVSTFGDRTRFKYRSAYVLMGRKNAGPGNGIEFYAGAFDADPGAIVDRFFSIQDGEFITGSSYTPSTSKTYRQDEIPTDATVRDGDLWIDTNDSNKLYLRESGAWVSVRDAGISQALQQAANAQSTADGKIDTYFSPSPPISASDGDIWFDSDDGNKQYTRSGGQWVVVTDTRLGDALAAAANATNLANSKITTWFQPNEPGSVYYPAWTAAPGPAVIGDLWFNTSDGRLWRLNHVPNVYIGWRIQSTVGAADIGTNKLGAGAATDTLLSEGGLDTLDDGSGGTERAKTLQTLGYTNNSGIPISVQFEATAKTILYSANYAVPYTRHIWVEFYTPSRGVVRTLTQAIPSISVDPATIADVGMFTLQPGESCSVAISAHLFSQYGAKITWTGSLLRLTAIKR